jgi:ABC-type lipoprotein release transport system permease subunit
MSWRNVWRNRRRSVLTVSAIALSLTFNILMRGIADGFHEQMVDNSVRANIGHIEVHRQGYHDDPGLNRTLPDPRRVDDVVRRLPHLRGSSLRVLGDGLASTSENSAGIAILGIDPAREPTVTTIRRAVVKGRYLTADEARPVLLGDRLAETLRAHLGDKIVLLVQAADGSMGAQLFRLTGIFRSGAPELDRGVAYILLRDAQELFSLGDRITEEVLLLDSSDAVAAAQRSLEVSLAGGQGQCEVLTWSQVEPFLEQFIVLDDAFFYIIVAILFIVISVGILNTILMSVFERVREFGVMMALGTRPRQVVLLVVLEAGLLALVGVAIGGTLGSLATLYFARAGIDLASFAEGAASIGITTTTVHSKLTAANLVLSNLAVFGLVVLVSLYPAAHAARLRPVEAIRHV